ncbi:hypothetical protein GLOIN_2v1787408 [Rhizophagus irregularis DAOM 181602=DAOM 197198]|uniref:Uncharacterized protein n=1 Tax=Rhizophagus irregularis (strain DAOM 181602 / DAOM 197198 / MUCL 43194) TaxID=747089 RepID=A0A2P4P5Y1_RHIID|nr:hypothetical protein GLOIN_2v1787408 [Rhizophagus irregularis DAOM 181602=DAOM 197198]POG60793.1 hypothetical protein GLOIN_2v1787408 [Rhizophagus irregularis DAOM 181602=DAOM 197198]GBC32185.2 hypothetical protein GLOIN_2v1787408 [Rhizophagus irregularis DAOM 181602=DAOM 197198]|eukprot:XP_025167659.1 hypothetical protein GLOIN_2v1787408 [Rhizophagus irregularis DAOM 181602=DAOM 197198]
MRSKLSELTTPSFEVVGVDLQVCKEKYERLINTTEKVLEFLKQRDKGNFKWVKGVKKISSKLKKCYPKLHYINVEGRCHEHSKIIHTIFYFFSNKTDIYSNRLTK